MFTAVPTRVRAFRVDDGGAVRVDADIDHLPIAWLRLRGANGSPR